MSSNCAVSIWPRLFLYKWWEQMAEIEINDFFSLLGNTMYIIKRLTVPTSGYWGLAHLAECNGHVKNPDHIKRGWCIYALLEIKTFGHVLEFKIWRCGINPLDLWEAGEESRCREMVSQTSRHATSPWPGEKLRIILNFCDLTIRMNEWILI